MINQERQTLSELNVSVLSLHAKHKICGTDTWCWDIRKEGRKVIGEHECACVFWVHLHVGLGFQDKHNMNLLRTKMEDGEWGINMTQYLYLQNNRCVYTIPTNGHKHTVHT